MDFNTLVTPTYIKDLKCSLCNNYLSYFPIHITTNKQNICGRCKTSEEALCLRNEVYEVIAKEILFPCRYINEGCVETFHAEDIPSHEDQCPLRLVKCPANEFSKCDEAICLRDVIQHCENKHSDFISSNGEFEVDLTKSEESNNIFIQDNLCFIFTRTFDYVSNKLHCIVYSFESELEPPSNVFEINLRNDINSVSMKGVPSRGGDDIGLHTFKISKKIQGKLCIGVQDDKVITNSIVGQELLKMFTCCKCSTYILPPVIVYRANQKTWCPSCRPDNSSPLADCGFNKLTEKLIFSCKFQKNGCNYTARPHLLKKHQLVCLYGNYSCLFKENDLCEWRGLGKDIIVHVNDEHNTDIAELSEFSLQIYKDEYFPYIYIIKFSRYFFRLVVILDSNYLCFAVHMIGEFQNDFKYELEIINLNKSCQKYVTIQPCLQLTTETENVSYVNKFSQFHWNQIVHMLSKDRNLKFKVRIFKEVNS